jgi:transcriptional regulator GlxA family with amidase domain
MLSGYGGDKSRDMQIRHSWRDRCSNVTSSRQVLAEFFGIFVGPSVNVASSPSAWGGVPLLPMGTASGRLKFRATTNHQEAVERAEAYLRQHLDGPVPLARLCRETGLSERGLRNAFYDVCGTSPMRHLRALRLSGVHRALCEASTTGTTVTSVATGYGFFELGRFAGTYRAVFGETPSDTLRGHGRRTAAHHPLDPRGHSDVCTT